MVGTWMRLAHITSDSASAEVTTGTFTAKENLKVELYYTGTGTGDPFISFNGDEAGNYANRYSRDGGSDSTDTSQSIGLRLQQGTTTPQYSVINITNKSDKEKLVIGNTITQGSSGAGNAPTRQEFAGKWTNTSAQITEITLDRASDNFASGSSITVWGASDDVLSDEKDSITNVEAGTRYEETDTRKIYRKVDPTPTTLSDDFSGTDDWVDNDSAAIGVSSGAMNWKSDESNTSNDASTYDLGVGNVSDTQWILRFEFKVVTKGTVGGGNGLSVGLGDSNQSVSSTTSQDWIGWNWNYDNTEKYLSSDSDNASMPQVWDGDGSQAFTFTTGTTYYVEVIRSSATVYTTEVFTNSDFSTGSQGKITGACASTNGSHRYIRVTNMANSSGAGGTDGTIKNIKFYNGVTSVSTDEWKERGTA